MNVRTALLPRDLPEDLSCCSTVVFDVLRATTTITAALAAGVIAIHIFDRLEDATQAAQRFPGRKVLCGERQCVPPPGFDLGNSPGKFNSSQHAGVATFMCTTNGTRAIAAARRAPAILAGALVNRMAVARRLQAINRDVLLLCAGTDGYMSMEDAIGAGSVIDQLKRNGVDSLDDASLLAWSAFRSNHHDLPAALRRTQGGQNVVAAGFPEDLAFCARLDVFDIVGVVDSQSLTILAERPSV